MKTFECLSFFRGMSEKYPTDRPFVHRVRSHRRPKDSSQNFHGIADQWFYERFGIRYRSNVVCVTSRELTALAYAATPAHVMRIVPLSEYRYCWSPNASDLLFLAKEMAQASQKEIFSALELLGYQEDGLEKASATGHEVMLHCDLYLAIPIDCLPERKVEASSRIILPP